MIGQTIESRDIKVDDIFQGFYEVPDYQREYVWEERQVEQLLSDINAERMGLQATNAPEYFIGSIVVCPKPDEVFQLIDGQQRMTTIFLILCAIRDRIKELNENPPGALDHQISATSTDSSGSDVFRYRLDLQYEDSGDIVEQIAKGTLNDGDGRNTRSINNIRNAYKTIGDFLSAEFGNHADEIRAFYGYLINKVKLIRIQTTDVAKALKIFETINDRGVSLDSMDLLKNLLFMKANQSDFESLKEHWKKLQDIIYDMGEKPLRFLRYFILSHYEISDLVREAEIYNWFVKNEKVCSYVTSPLDFVNELVQSATAYRNFLEGRDQNGDKNRNLDNLRLLGGRATRQHLILLLAGRHLPGDLFEDFVGEVEMLLFVYLITREPTRNLERNFARWAVDIQRITGKSELENFIDRRFRSAKKELSIRFSHAWKELYFGSVRNYQLLYILAKLTQYLDRSAYGDNEMTKWLRSYTEGGYEIEHIHPSNPSKEAAEEFGLADDLRVADKLGNLVLLEKSINASLRNAPYSKKRPGYQHSKLLLTSSLANKVRVGNRTKIDVAVEDLQPFAEWNEKAVVERQEQLGKLARAVWGVP